MVPQGKLAMLDHEGEQCPSLPETIGGGGVLTRAESNVRYIPCGKHFGGEVREIEHVFAFYRDN